MGKFTAYTVESYRNSMLSEKLKQKLFFHTQVPLLQRKDDKKMYCIPFDYNKAKTSGYLSDMKW